MIPGLNVRVDKIFEQSPEMIEYCKIQPGQVPIATDEPAPRTRNGSENLQNDPFTSTGHTRDRADLAYNNHQSFFNRLNEGTGSSSNLDSPTAQPTGSGQSDLLGVTNASEKPPPVRKTRATATDVGARKLISRSIRDNNAETKRPVSSASSTTEPTVPAAPARRSTRLNTLKISGRLGTGVERETRLPAKDREQKKRTVSARLRSNVTGSVAGSKDKDKEDVNVRDNPNSSHPDRPVRASTQHATDDGLGTLKRKNAPTEPSLTRVPKKQMSDAPPRQPLAPTKDKNKEDALVYLLDMYRRLGNGYFNLHRYNCPGSLEELRSLPDSQRETPRIQCLMGKAYYEMAQYNEVRVMLCFMILK
jgi:anaphase-promoting complex subunit 3